MKCHSKLMQFVLRLTCFFLTLPQEAQSRNLLCHGLLAPSSSPLKLTAPLEYAVRVTCGPYHYTKEEKSGRADTKIEKYPRTMQSDSFEHFLS